MPVTRLSCLYGLVKMPGREYPGIAGSSLSDHGLNDRGEASLACSVDTANSGGAARAVLVSACPELGARSFQASAYAG